MFSDEQCESALVLHGDSRTSRAVKEQDSIPAQGDTVKDSKVSVPPVSRHPKTNRRTEGGRPAPERTGWSRDGQSRPAFQDRNSNQETQGPVKRLYFGNLPAIDSPSDVEQAIHTLIDPLGIEITNVSNLRAPHESKAAEPGDHHYCFVDIARPEDVDAVIEALDGKPAPWSQDGSSTLKVNRAREQANRRFGDRGQGQPQGQGQGFGSQGGYQSRRTEGQRDWRTAAQRQEAPQ